MTNQPNQGGQAREATTRSEASLSRGDDVVILPKLCSASPGVGASWLIFAVAMCGCSESTMIRTNPPGASVYVNERYVGGSPVEFEVSSWSVRPHKYRYRTVKPGYALGDGEIPAHLSIGRIVAAYLSGCMSCARGFFVFDEDTVVTLIPEETSEMPPSQ